MFSALHKYSNSRQLFGLITSVNDSDNFCIITMDSMTQDFVNKLHFPISQAEAVLAEIEKAADCFKAIVVELYGSNLSATPFKSSYGFRKELKEILEKSKVPYYFISEENFLFTTLLIATEVSLKLDENIFLVLPYDSAKMSLNTFGVIVGEFKFTVNGYQFADRKNLDSLNTKTNPKILCQQICGIPNPKKVIVASFGCKGIPFKKMFKPKCVTLFNCCVACHSGKVIAEICKWMFDKSYVKYYILPTSIKTIEIFGNYGSEKNRLNIIKVEMNEALPITKTATFVKSVPEVCVYQKDSHSREFTFQKDLPKDCHEWEVTVTIDENNFEDVEIDQMVLDDFDMLNTKLNVKMKSKIPFIGFFDNSSVISICDNSGRYEFMEEWNGQYGVDCFISFDQKRPKYGQKAAECLKTKNSFVVFDLLKIMSMPADDIRIENTWGFTFTSNEENPILLEFDNFDGTKKAASPPFLMAMFLRQHLKTIEVKIGEKPKEIGLWIFKQDFNEEEMERIKEGLKESCKLLKLDECCFVKIDTDMEINSNEIEFIKIGV